MSETKKKKKEKEKSEREKVGKKAKTLRTTKRKSQPTASTTGAGKVKKTTRKAPAAKKPKATPVAAMATAIATAPTKNAIAIRAYFLAQHRQSMGHHGDPHSDWVEAERQLLSESGQ